jgi:hypothetical protein
MPSEVLQAASRESTWFMFRAFRSGGDSVVEPVLGFVDIHHQQGNFGTFEEYPL